MEDVSDRYLEEELRHCDKCEDSSDVTLYKIDEWNRPDHGVIVFSFCQKCKTYRSEWILGSYAEKVRPWVELLPLRPVFFDCSASREDE